ncbi:galactose oxidase [Trichodelitschia bisporula]|uniref:Galactose oxidase n=1 Tax=Trichodelitschia bisporula TaxID=703511 RepID=A0A6G1HVN6_9PEZI|nr:galactose oxidase [Trichodelitschia bisporula]
MAGKKDKKKSADKKARVAQKQEKKAAQKEKKGKSKPRDADDSDADDVDIDAVLAEYARQQEQFLKVTEVSTDPPSPRSSATLIASPANDHELFLFGGEYFNGALASFNNDLYVYNTHRDDWRRVTSPNSPLPRSGHAWTRAANTKDIYLFGGEFSSPKQGTFYHYNDFWRLDPASREWTRVDTKGKSPPARSGHRMTSFKNYIILFGGFQDTAQQTRYLSDLWIYDCLTFIWHEPKLPSGGAKPDPRSSFSFLPYEAGAALYGGYSRVKATKGGGSGKKGGGPASRTVLKPLVHSDAWFLRITPPAPEAPSGTLPAVRWERRKKPANAPVPTRAGATMCAHRGRGIQFGGVHDVEESEEGIDSEFFNQLWAWNIERNRYFSLILRRPRQAGKKAVQSGGGGGGRRDRGRQAEEELLANLRALEMKAGGTGDTEEANKLEAEKEKEEEPAAAQKPVVFEMPHPRFNAQLAVQGDMLYIFGGTFEKGDQEFTFDEMWAIDLGKLDGVREVFKRELQDWQGSDDEEESEEEDEDEDEEDEEEALEVDSTDAASTADTAATSVTDKGDLDAAEEEQSALTDTLPHPRPFESLRDFYTRTSVQWQELVIEGMSKGGSAEGQSVKDIRKKAFDRAEDKWWDCREEIRALEDEQMEAGIGDVVSLAEKEGTAGGVGRRR